MNIYTGNYSMQTNKPERNSDKFWQALIDSSNELIIAVDYDIKPLFANRVCRQTLGFNLEHIVANPDFLSAILLNYEEIYPELVASSTNPGITRLPDATIRTAEGSWRLFNLHVNNLLAEPGVKCLILTLRELSQLESNLDDDNTKTLIHSLFNDFATVHFYNQSKEKGIKATGIGIE
jgi:PAS domain-containing protein